MVLDVWKTWIGGFGLWSLHSAVRGLLVGCAEHAWTEWQVCLEVRRNLPKLGDTSILEAVSQPYHDEDEECLSIGFARMSVSVSR